MSTASDHSRSRNLSESRQRLRNAGRHLPQRPGVYIMMDVHGTVIYVGKAVNLRRRVGSYATPSAARDRKVSKLVAAFDSLSYIETNSELEALLVESRLIKAALPMFNRQLIDPESCCFLKTDFRKELPRIEVVARTCEDGAAYLGPFWISSQIRECLDAVENAFCLRRCPGEIPANTRRTACIYHELGKCVGPCSGRVSAEQYKGIVQMAWNSLAGKSREAIDRLAQRRNRLADGLRFEDALIVQRQIRALEQIAVSNADVAASEGDFAVVTPSYLHGRPVVLVFKDGRLGCKFLAGPRRYPDSDMLAHHLSHLDDFIGDLLPGKPSTDDRLIIHSYLRRRQLAHSLLPLHAGTPVAELANLILAAIDTLRH